MMDQLVQEENEHQDDGQNSEDMEGDMNDMDGDEQSPDQDDDINGAGMSGGEDKGDDIDMGDDQQQ